ncbi:MAG: sugar-binding protein [Eubacteriales bacterium]
MRKILCILLVISLLVVPAALTASASDKTTTAFKGTPVVDGKIDEIWEHCDKIQAANFKAGDLASDPGVCKLYARTLWDDKSLYVLFEVVDPVISVASATTWQQDSVEFYVDEDNSKSGAFDTNDIQIRVNAENFFEVDPSRITSVVGKSSDGYIIEVKYNFIEVMPKAGASIGFDIQVNDDMDGSGSRATCLGWSDDTDKASSDTTVWGNLVYSADAPPAPATEAPTEAAETPTAPKTFDGIVLMLLASLSAAAAVIFAYKRKYR